jgi:alpha-1,2-mannosyltransferase
VPGLCNLPELLFFFAALLVILPRLQTQERGPFVPRFLGREAMNSPTDCAATPWYTSSRFQTVALWLFVALAGLEGYVAVVQKDNDFLWHCRHGASFLANGATPRDHYLPSRGLMNIALSLLPYHATKAVVYPLALVLLVACFCFWERMAGRVVETTKAAPRSAGIFAAILLLPYLLRDLDECGLQIVLLFMLTMAGYALSRGNAIQAGFWLATAVAFKVTPLLGLPFLLWKRQWRAAAATVVFLLLWAAAPSLITGWEQNLRAYETWLAEAKHIKDARQAYPSLVEREPQKLFNLSLQAAIARWLETYPPGHPLYLEHPWFVQAGDLSGESAYQVEQAILLVLGLGYLWKIRRPWQHDGGGALPSEWASLCGLCALLSPLCWKHHFVLALPAAFLVSRDMLTRSQPGRWRVALFGALGVMIYACRDFIAGRELAAVLLSYKFDTWAVSALLVWTLWLPRRLAAPMSAGPHGSAAIASRPIAAGSTLHGSYSRSS